MIGTRPRTPPAMSAPAFFTDLARLLNSGQTRAAVLAGNVHDLFPVESGGEGGTDFVPLVPFLLNKTDAPGLVRVVYELNGPVRVAEKDRAELRDAWVRWKAGADADTLLLRGLGKKGPNEGELLGREFDDLLHEATGRPTQALEFLRQLTICSRAALSGSLLIFIEAADVLLPAGQGGVSGLPHDQLRRVAIVEDWFCDPAFLNGGDAVVLIADSRGAVHPRVARLPQVLGVEVPAPDAGLRLRYIESFQKDSPKPVRFWAGEEHGPRALADFTAGLNLHALRQLLAGAAHGGEPVEPAGVIGKVEEFIQAQLGEDVIEFKKPAHGLGDVVGFTNLKAFLKTDLIPRFRASGEAALPGAAVAGAIGCHRAGQELLAHDGRRVRVEDVAEGDRLMGPDSCPRTVRRLVRGEGPMVEVVPRKGRPFAVNLDHVLTLKRTRKTNTKTDNLVGEVVDVSVRDLPLLVADAEGALQAVLHRREVPHPTAAGGAVLPRPADRGRQFRDGQPVAHLGRRGGSRGGGATGGPVRAAVPAGAGRSQPVGLGVPRREEKTSEPADDGPPRTRPVGPPREGQVRPAPLPSPRTPTNGWNSSPG